MSVTDEAHSCDLLGSVADGVGDAVASEDPASRRALCVPLGIRGQEGLSDWTRREKLRVSCAEVIRSPAMRVHEVRAPLCLGCAKAPNGSQEQRAMREWLDASAQAASRLQAVAEDVVQSDDQTVELYAVRVGGSLLPSFRTEESARTVTATPLPWTVRLLVCAQLCQLWRRAGREADLILVTVANGFDTDALHTKPRDGAACKHQDKNAAFCYAKNRPAYVWASELYATSMTRVRDTVTTKFQTAAYGGHEAYQKHAQTGASDVAVGLALYGGRLSLELLPRTPLTKNVHVSDDTAFLNEKLQKWSAAPLGKAPCSYVSVQSAREASSEMAEKHGRWAADTTVSQRVPAWPDGVMSVPALPTEDSDMLDWMLGGTSTSSDLLGDYQHTHTSTDLRVRRIVARSVFRRTDDGTSDWEVCLRAARRTEWCDKNGWGDFQ